MSSGDPADTWTDPTEISPVHFTGVLTFSCCRKIQRVEGEGRSDVQCVRCGTLYGLAMLVRLQSADDYRFAPGTRVRPKERLQVKAGASKVTLDPESIYQATQDTYGALNVPPGHQPVRVNVPGDRGPRMLVAIVPADQLEAVQENFSGEGGV